MDKYYIRKNFDNDTVTITINTRVMVNAIMKSRKTY